MTELPVSLFDEARFAAGPGLGFVGATTLGLFEPMNATLVEAIWDLVAASSSPEEILELLSSNGLRSLGSFAIAHFDGTSTMLIVRGDASIVGMSSQGEVRHTASGARTWAERQVDGLLWCAAYLDAGSNRELDFRVRHGLVPAVGIGVGDGALRRQVSADSVALLTHGSSPILAPPVQAHGLDDDFGRTITPSDLADSHRPQWLRNEPDVAAQVGQALDDPVVQEMYGATVARSVLGAAVRDGEGRDGDDGRPVDQTIGGGLIAGVPGGLDASAAPLSDFHDGHTMSRSQLQALRHGTGGALAAPIARPLGHQVQARLCANQHPNPVHSDICRECGLPVVGTPTTVARPRLGVLRFGTGELVSVDRPVLIGRNPKVEGAVGSELPQMVKLDIGQGLSRTHASVRPEGWQLLVEDLNSANGTIVTLPGRPPHRLHAREPQILERGAVIDFGGEVTCVVE